jgi:hypothetical protein
MIKPQQLRLGNMVRHNHQVLIVNIILLQQLLSDNAYFIEGIPIDDVWHKRMGGIFNSYKNWEYIIDKYRKLVFSGDYVFLRTAFKEDGTPSPNDELTTLWNQDKTCRKMHVHELQNIYTLFANTELNIKL